MARAKRRSTFTSRDPDFAAKLEFLPEVAAPKLIDQDEAKKAQAGDSASATAAVEPSELSHDDVPQAPKVQVSTSIPSPRARPQKERAPRSHAGTAPVTVRVYFCWREDMAARAAKWAVAARCPPKKIFQQAWAKMKDDILAEIEAGIRYKDIPHDRVSDAGERFDTRIQISAKAFEQLQRELDPEGFVGVSPALSRWVREQAFSRIDSYFAKAGY